MALRRFTVEVPLFLSLFSLLFTGSIFSNLIIFRTCYVTLGYNKTECALLGTVYNNDTEKLEKLVQPHAATLNMVRSTCDSVVAVFLCLFIGPWSDKFGRKPILVACLTGYTLSYFGTFIFSCLQDISPWYSVLCAIPITLTGGNPTYFTSCLSYVTDTSNNDNRSIRMAIIEGFMAAALLLGNVSSSYVFYATNYMSVFAIATGLCTLGTVYTIFFIPESLQTCETEGKLRGFFQTSNIGGIMKMAIKKRENYKREVILLVFLVAAINMFITNGDTSVMFLYFREKFDWTLTKFTLYGGFTNLMAIVATILGIYILQKILKIRDTVLLLLGFASTLTSALLLGVGNSDYYIYAAGVIRCLGGIINPILNFLLSKLVPTEEIGKLFSMTLALQFAIGLGAGPLYTLIYNDTIDTDPGIYNYVTAGLYIFNITLVIVLMFVQNISQDSYGQLTNEENQESTETL